MTHTDLQILASLIIGFVIGVFCCSLWYGYKYDKGLLNYLKNKKK